MSSHNPDLFITAPPLDAVCPVCHNVMGLPVMIQCGHSFCQDCLPPRLPTCPICRTKITKHRSLPVNYSLKGIIESFEIRCVNFTRGCTHTARLSSMSPHDDKCLFAPCCCAHKGCPLADDTQQSDNMILLKKDKETHEQSCAWRPVACPNPSCMTKMPSKELPSHHQTCRFAIVPCIHGCGSRIPRGLSSRHQVNCPQIEIPCVVAGCKFKALRGAEDLWDRHMSTFARKHIEALVGMVQNHAATIAAQREQIEALESQVTQLRQNPSHRRYPTVRWVVPDFSEEVQSPRELLSDELKFEGVNPHHNYSFVLMCCANDEDNETDEESVGVYFVPRPGPDPDDLEWPIPAPISLRICNRVGGEDAVYVIQPSSGENLDFDPPAETNTEGLGYQFLTNGEMHSTDWVLNDCLVIEASLMCECCELKPQADGDD